MVDNYFHASIILNIHREAVFLRRTLLSLDEAVRFSQSKGLRLELVAVLDRTDDATREVLSSFDLGSYQGVQIIDVDHGSLGLSRNAGIARAHGEYIFTADGDDLVSYNYFHDLLMRARVRGKQTLCFPGAILGFGEKFFVVQLESSKFVPPKAFVDAHPYISRACAHRDLFLSTPFRDVRLTKAYAYEDWHFNAEVLAAGFDIDTVAGTFLFYRQWSQSLATLAKAISIRQIPPTRLFEPATLLKLSHEFDCRREAEDEKLRSVDIESSKQVYTADAQTKDIIARANAIEPAIKINDFLRCKIKRNSAGAFPAGTAYLNACKIIQDRDFSDVFLLPSISGAGVERSLLSIMEAFYEINPFGNVLVILGESTSDMPWLSRLPINVVVLDMGLHNKQLSLSQRCLVALKIIEGCSLKARIHMCQSNFADTFLDMYGVVLKDRECIYYRSFDIMRIEGGHATVIYSPLEIICKNIDNLSKIISDGMSIIKKDHHRLGIQHGKWQCLHSCVEIPAVLPARCSDASGRILWASCFDTQRRPSLLPLIADRLGKIAPDRAIDVFGGSTPDELSFELLKAHRNIEYHGPYSDFGSLPLTQISIFLYTSLYDGIPNTLLEAMSYGLAIVAPDVGGVSEIIRHGETGILLPSLPDDSDMANLYTEALLTLMSSPDVCKKLGHQARAFVKEHHSPEAHVTRVAELFQMQRRHFQYA